MLKTQLRRVRLVWLLLNGRQWGRLRVVVEMWRGQPSPAVFSIYTVPPQKKLKIQKL